jgi:glyoxylase-like metal-dependent hydrolase (beta-lactamase superfamily II)
MGFTYYPVAPALLALAIGTPASAPPGRKVIKLAEGVYEIEHQDPHDPDASGNTTVVIGDRQVLVVDTGFLPSDASLDIAQIREWTDRPVSFVVNTHFHNDHNFGNRVYLDAFPGVTIVAHAETKKEMDRFGPGSATRMERGAGSLRRMLETGKTKDGQVLSDSDKAQVRDALARRLPAIEAMKKSPFQSATLVFERDFGIDLGNREVQIKFLGRGNTAGDAVVYLPKERIVVAGDLVVFPIPYLYDGYPSEWVGTLQNLAQLDADAIVPGHGPVLRDKAYVLLLRDLFRSAVDQLNVRLGQTSPAMFQTVDDVKSAIDLSLFRPRFAGSDQDLAAEFDAMVKNLINVVFREASLR